MSLHFDEHTHTYTCNGQVLQPVTKFIKAFFSDFNKREIIPQLQKQPDSKYWGKSYEEIEAMWQAETDAGTKLHKDIEEFMLGKEVYNESIEFVYFLDFDRQFRHKGHKAFKTEFRIFDEDIGLAGTIDMLYKKDDGTYVIVDWKRSKKITTDSWGKFASTPIKHIPDTNYYHYTLQLNMYKYILQTKYNMVISEMFLAQLHPDNSDCVVIEVSDKQNEIREMLRSVQ